MTKEKKDKSVTEIIKEAMPVEMYPVNTKAKTRKISPYKSREAKNYVFARINKYLRKYIVKYFELSKENSNLVEQLRQERLRYISLLGECKAYTSIMSINNHEKNAIAHEFETRINTEINKNTRL